MNRNHYTPREIEEIREMNYQGKLLRDAADGDGFAATITAICVGLIVGLLVIAAAWGPF